jgi:hypothetical protein
MTQNLNLGPTLSRGQAAFEAVKRDMASSSPRVETPFNGKVSKEDRAVDYLMVAELMAEAAAICARSSIEKKTSGEIMEAFPDGAEHFEKLRIELFSLAKWFAEDSRHWRRRAKELVSL